MARPRGFIHDYNPKAKTLSIIEDVQTILLEEMEALPLTIRQIFYMLVSDYGYDKTERAYQNLIEILNRARRAKIIDMDDIRDDGLKKLHSHGWGSKDGFLRYLRRNINDFTLDRQDDQEVKLIVWCEAAGMAPQLHEAVEDYHIPVLSSGGFDSLTTKYETARWIARELRHVEILHLGDLDPSGVHLYKSLDEDLQSFIYELGGIVELSRIAVTPEQVEEFNLPTAPPKKSDKRSFSGMTTQCEAIRPKQLRKIVIDAVEDRLDMDAYTETLEREREITRELMAKFGDV